VKTSRDDQRRVTIRYRHDGATGRSTLVLDVEAPEEDMPHEHRQDLKEMAERLLGVPLGSLPEGIEVNLRRTQKVPHDHDHDHDHGPEPAQAPAREAQKA
jgi:hypothetical protein